MDDSTPADATDDTRVNTLPLPRRVVLNAVTAVSVASLLTGMGQGAWLILLYL